MHRCGSNAMVDPRQSREAKTCEARQRYIQAKERGETKVSLTAVEAQRRAERSVFRLR